MYVSGKINNLEKISHEQQDYGLLRLAMVWPGINLPALSRKSADQETSV
jgi:hypothetical protein